MLRLVPSSAVRLCAVALLVAPPAAHAQDRELTEPLATVAPEPDPWLLARDAERRGDDGEALSRYLRILSASPDSVPALNGAGQAALGVGDLNAAAGFFSRADALDPRNGPAKAGLARTMLRNGNARGALRLFREAAELGVPATTFVADRGLAYDLRGDTRRAQADYQAALLVGPDKEVVRRLAISQAIAGDRVSAMATLDPLLRQQDVPAWRTRAFVLALTGDAAAATQAAGLVMPADQVAALTPYLGRMAGLRMADKAAAIHLGRFPGEERPPVRVAAAPRLVIDRAALAPVAAPSIVAPPPPPPAAPAPVASAIADAERLKADAAAQAKAEARAQAAAKVRADAQARAKKEREEKAAAQALARKNPARHFVQVAGGANASDLPREWAKLKTKWPGQLAGRTPWSMAYRFTNRLLIGPFPSAAAAQGWVTERKAEGFATFRVSTRAGEEVQRLN